MVGENQVDFLVHGGSCAKNVLQLEGGFGGCNFGNMGIFFIMANMYLSIGEWMEMNKVWSVGWGKFAAMITEKYPYKNTNLFANFEFESIGPKGKIKKIIQYELMGQLEDGTPLFNLAFGDYNKKRKNYSDLTISNNEDKNKVLATVASTTLDFSANYTRVAIHAKGSTPARTRLYQIGINTFKTEITGYFKILGNSNDNWEDFESGVNYDAFLAIKK